MRNLHPSRSLSLGVLVVAFLGCLVAGIVWVMQTSLAADRTISVKQVEIPRHSWSSEKQRLEQLDRLFRDIQPGERQAVDLVFQTPILWSTQSYDVNCYSDEVTEGHLTVISQAGYYRFSKDGQFRIRNGGGKPLDYEASVTPGFGFNFFERRRYASALGYGTVVSLSVPKLTDDDWALLKELSDSGATGQSLELRREGRNYLARVIIEKSDDFQGEISDWRLLRPK